MWYRHTVHPASSRFHPVTVNLDASIPTFTPDVAFDLDANAYRVRFAPNGTWIGINAAILADTSRRYNLSAMQEQTMCVSIAQGRLSRSM
ncbi:MAG: hypothetical protein ABSA23_18525 [Anaerolineales bacterium]